VLSMKRSIKETLNNRLIINSYLIMIARAIGSVTGYIFWVLAARLILPEDVGLASSVISASLLIANLSQLGYGYGLVRFLPHADRPSDLINLAFETTFTFSFVLSVVFVAFVHILSPELVIIRTSISTLLSFVLLVVVTSLNQVLNWIFFARRKFLFSLFYITAQSVLAIVFLFILAKLKLGFEPILWAYAGASLIGMFLSMWLFLFRSEPGFRFSLVFRKPDRSPFTSYLVSSYITDQLLRNTMTLIPLLVVNTLGPESSAFFFMPWSIVSGLVSLIGGISSSLFAEGSNQPEKVNHYMSTSLKLGLIYSSGACFVVSLFSKFILSIFGPEYVKNASTLFVVMLLSIIPGIVIHIFISFFRIQTRTWYLLGYAFSYFSVGILASYFGMKAFGQAGIGYGWLASQVLVVLIGIILRISLSMKIKAESVLTPSA